MSCEIRVPGICGAELHEKKGYGVKRSVATTFPSTWVLATATDVEGVLEAANTGSDGTSTGELCTVILFSEDAPLYLGSNVTTDGDDLTTDANGAWEPSTAAEESFVKSRGIGSSGGYIRGHVNFLRPAISSGGVLAALAAAASAIDVNGQNITNVGTVDGVDVSALVSCTATNVLAALAAAAGAIDCNAQNITNVGTVDGVDVSAIVTCDDTNVLAVLAALSGAADFNGQNITNVGTVDGVDVSAIVTCDDTNVLAVLAALSGAADLNGQNITNVGTVDGVDVSEVVAENTDGQIAVDLSRGLTDNGTFTATIDSSGRVSLTRTAAATNDGRWIPLELRARSTASKGVKITSVEVNYSVDTADADDVQIQIWKQTQTADGIIPAVATIQGGNDNAHYDSNHDTPAKRGDDTGAPEEHLSVMTLPSPAYIADNEIWSLRLYVDGDAGGASDVVFKTAVIHYSETLVDAA